ncbi:Anaphase-promoting complex subunit 1 [Tilletia horrida]|uniref:Anaphase-promoting complex subunit 1 n=1 Tax=Tilletia horrida TaxID=155126 RepID=A0AAN6JTT4_9BASI|nr:Anaphase-promoting complex subunit 1 [Tilletia horrida]KAK0569006.1 Anaphase-promoting complex subunit 1 [Tilletia horrida]
MMKTGAASSSLGQLIAQAQHTSSSSYSPSTPHSGVTATLERRLNAVLKAAAQDADGQLGRLQALLDPASRRAKSESPSTSQPRQGTSTTRTLVESSIDGTEILAQEELCWFGNTLVWSRRPSTLIRSFSFSTPITHACWARFELSNVALSERSEIPPRRRTQLQHPDPTQPQDKSSAGSTAPAPIITYARPGGFTLAQTYVRSLDQGGRSRGSHRPGYRRTKQSTDDDADPNQSNVQTAVCIFLEHTLILYFPSSGNEHQIHLPFRVSTVFPLALGLLVQRELEAEDHRYEAQQHQNQLFRRGSNGRQMMDIPDMTDDDNMEDVVDSQRQTRLDMRFDVVAEDSEPVPQPMPLVFYLSRPFDEFSGFDRVTQVIETQTLTEILPSVNHVGAQPSGYLNRSPMLVSDFSDANFPDLKEHVIFVSDLKDGPSLPLIVTAHHGKRAIRICQYGLSGTALQSVKSVSAVMSSGDSQEKPGNHGPSQPFTLSYVQASALELQASNMDAAMSQYTGGTAETQPSQMATAKVLGRGRPPPRRSARIEIERRASGLAAASGSGSQGSGSGVGTGTGGTNSQPRSSQRLSRRISSSSHGADLRRASTRAIGDRTAIASSMADDIHSGLRSPLADDDERGGFAEVVESINRETYSQPLERMSSSMHHRGDQIQLERASQPIHTGMSGLNQSQFLEDGGPHSQPVHSTNSRARSASATQRPGHARRSSNHLSMSRTASGMQPVNGIANNAVVSSGSSNMIAGPSQSRHGSGSSSQVSRIGGRPSTRRQPSLGAGASTASAMFGPGGSGTDVGGGGGGAPVGGMSQYDRLDRTDAAANIVHQAEAMAHEPAAVGAGGGVGPGGVRRISGNGVLGTGRGHGEEEDALKGSGDFARTFGGVALLDEIRIDGLDSEDKALSISAFLNGVEGGGSKTEEHGVILSSAILWIKIPFANKLISRSISEIPLRFTETGTDASSLGFTLRSAEPDPSVAQPVVEANAADLVRRGSHAGLAAPPSRARSTEPTAMASPDMIVRLSDATKHLVLGNPAVGQPTIALPSSFSFPSPSHVQDLDAKEVPAISCALTNRVLDALERTLLSREGTSIRHSVLKALSSRPQGRNEWNLFTDVIIGQSNSENASRAHNNVQSRIKQSRAHQRYANELALFRNNELPSQALPDSAATSAGSDHQRSQTGVLHVLHLIAQELSMITTSQSSRQVTVLARLIVQLACKLGRLSHAEYWIRLIPEVADQFEPGHVSPEDDLKVPTVHGLLLAVLAGGAQKNKPGLDETILGTFLGPIRNNSATAAVLCPTLTRLVEVYQVLGEMLWSIAAGVILRATKVIDAIVRCGWTRQTISELRFSLALPLWEVIRVGQTEPDVKWPAEALELVDRLDLLRSREDKAHMALGFTEAQLRTLPKKEHVDPLSAALFASDFRLEEVTKMMYTSGPIVVDFAERDEKKTDAEVKEEQSRIYWSVTERIKATTVGKGAFMLMSKPMVDTKLWDMPNLCLDLKGEPNALITSWPVNKVAEYELDWPEFHNGVAAALSISAEDGQVFESDWIFSHYGPEPSAKHAGFLFGLGLLGRLKGLGRVHAYRYFAPRHGLTTIGIVLGLGASFVGTGDPAVRQLMALQIAAFLPDGSAPLNQSMLTQTAGILGMGLTFMGSYHRWTAERLLAQIKVENVQTSDNPMFLRDAYSLSSGFALGLVMLGKGRRDAMTDAADRRMVASLVELIEGPSPVLFEGETSGLSTRDTTITNIPATIALGLIFLRSHRQDVVSQLLRLPTSVDALEYVRPDTLFARALTRHLIMWDDIKADEDWMESTLPSYLRTHSPYRGKHKDGVSSAKRIREKIRVKLGTFSESKQLAYLNLHAACCFVLGLKWAGSQNLQAAERLLNEYDAFVDLLRPPTTTYFERIRRAALQTAKDLTLLSAAMILAGSGNLSLLTRLRIEHGRLETPPSQTVYGTHLSSHLALGFLFLGGGRFTFGNSDGAISALLISCFPRFPATSSENRAHLQAYRHLWVLAVEPRLVVAQDVESGIVQGVDAILDIKVNTGPVSKLSPAAQIPTPPQTSRLPLDMDILNIMAPLPGQIPPFEIVDVIRVESTSFWSTELLVGRERQHARRLLLTRRLPVKRKSGFPTLLSGSSYASELARGGARPNGLSSLLKRLTSVQGMVNLNGGARDPNQYQMFLDMAVEKTFSLERRTLSTSIGLEHTPAWSTMEGLISDTIPSINSSSITSELENIKALLSAYVRNPKQRDWLRLIQKEAFGRSLKSGEGRLGAFQQFAVRALIYVLVHDAPAETLEQGFLGLFWRVTELCTGDSLGTHDPEEAGADIRSVARATHVGQMREDLDFLQALYSLRRKERSTMPATNTSMGPPPAAPGQGPLLFTGLGLRWGKEPGTILQLDPLVPSDLVDATIRDLRTWTRRCLWASTSTESALSLEKTTESGQQVFSRFIGSDVDSALILDVGEVKRLSAMFSGMEAPWLWTVLRPLFGKASDVARQRLGQPPVAEERVAAVKDFIGRMVEWTLAGISTGDGQRERSLEGYVQDAFVEAVLERAMAPP